jgi:hypothetical protein
MASPWKFLARLVSPGREQKREDGSTEKVSPEALPSSGSTETPTEDSLNSDGRPAGEDLPRHGQPGAISLKPVHSEEAENDVHDKVDGEVAKIAASGIFTSTKQCTSSRRVSCFRRPTPPPSRCSIF